MIKERESELCCMLELYNIYHDDEVMEGSTYVSSKSILCLLVLHLNIVNIYNFFKIYDIII